MNIFKVIASAPRSRFSENQVSAILTWLLNPHMDHGLGYAFLLKFLERIEIEKEILDQLKISLSDKNENIKVEIYPEYEVSDPLAIIDVMLIIGEKYYISIENKIYSKSASDEEQLKTQYEGLRKEIEENQKVIIVFLIPEGQSELIETAYNNLKVKNPDKKFKITWTEIAKDIQDILEKEQKCEISPLGEYLRHTLKAFSAFITGGFKGYNSAKSKRLKDPENANKGRKTYKEIHDDSEIRCIGIQWGENTLRRRMDVNELLTTEFWCSSNATPPRQWITKKKFLDIVESRIKEEL